MVPKTRSQTRLLAHLWALLSPGGSTPSLYKTIVRNIIFAGVVLEILGVVRLQSDAFESELKVRQKERVPSRFDTRLWLYRLRGRVESGAFRFK